MTSPWKLDQSRRRELRNLNLHALQNRPDEDKLLGLDGSLKKNTAFVKRLRSISPGNVESLLAELNGLRLTKYLEEAVACLLENRFKTAADIAAAVELCSRLHQRYGETSTFLRVGLFKAFEAAKGSSPNDTGHFRSLLRLHCELQLVGIVDDLASIHSALGQLLSEDETRGPTCISVALTFVRAFGPLFLGTSDVATGDDPIPDEWKCKFSELVGGYFKAMCRVLVKSHRRLKGMQFRSREHYETRGDLSERQSAQLQEAAEALDKLRTSLTLLAEALGEPLPDLRGEEEPHKIVMGKIVFTDPAFEQQDRAASSIYDSEEDRLFYENILDLRDRIPEALLPAADTKDDANEALSEQARLDSIPDVNPDDIPLCAEEPCSPDVFFAKLQSMYSAALVDQAAMEFCYVNSKSMRRRLGEHLLGLPRNRIDILPFVGRFLATIKPFFPDVVEQVSSSLMGQFHFLWKNKIAAVGTRSRVCRFLGELTKFRVLSQGMAFACLKKAIDDFSLHNIDMICFLLETCGRFLYHQAESHKRLELLVLSMSVATVSTIETVLKKKQSSTLDQNQIIMLENSLFMVCPPEVRPIAPKTREPIELYVVSLLRYKLCAKNVTETFRTVQSLDWSDPTTKRVLGKVFSKIWKVRYASIPLFAAMVGALMEGHGDFCVEVVDNVVEEVRIGLENNLVEWNQRRIATVRYLGELFSYSAIDASVVFDTLNTLLLFGHAGIPRKTHIVSVDLPDDFFRIRLCCVLLQCCGQYFVSGALRRQLEGFMALFQYYILVKERLSVDIGFLVEDTFELLKVPLIGELQEAVDNLVVLSDGVLSFLKDESGERPPKAVADDAKEEPDDREFERAFSGMVDRSLESRRLERRIRPFEAAVPVSLGKKDPSAIKLLARCKNRAFAKELDVPLPEAGFLVRVLASQKAQLAEQRELKKKTLEIQMMESESSGDELARSMRGKFCFRRRRV